MTRPAWFIALEKFGPGYGRAWQDYLAWARLPHLIELVSLDTILCPTLFRAITAEDWQHNVQQDFLTSFFTDLDYLLARVEQTRGKLEGNLLAAVCEPEPADLLSPPDERFVFQGFDLVESPGLGVSALSNCGGFELAFQPGELNAVGLLDEYAFARTVQRRLLEHYPGEHHADCCLWAIWRLEK